MLKFAVVLHRRLDLSTEAFRAYFRDVHAPLAEALPGLSRYVVNFPAEDPGREAPAWDAIVEFYWDDREAMEAAWASAAGRKATDDLVHCADLERSSWGIVEPEHRL